MGVFFAVITYYSIFIVLKLIYISLVGHSARRGHRTDMWRQAFTSHLSTSSNMGTPQSIHDPPAGFAAHYASWRDMQYALLASGLLSFITVLLFLPETSHPMARGIDKLRIAEEPSSGEESKRKGWRWVWVNPFSSLWLLRSPNLLIVVRTFSNTLL